MCSLWIGNLILNSASSLLPQTSTTQSSQKENTSKSPATGAKREPKPLSRNSVTVAGKSIT